LDEADGAVLYGTFLGGRGLDGGWLPEVAAGPGGRIYVAGSTSSTDFPTTAGAFDTSYAGSGDVFALLLAPGGLATATPTPTATATPSATPSPTPTPTSTATAEPSATATPTASPMPSGTPTSYLAYLPLALNESCPPKDHFVDVALVLDASTSMLERDSTGRTKLESAVAALRPFLAWLRLEPGKDRAAILTFNDGGRILAPLTADESALEAALGAIEIRLGSRLDLGIATGAAVLSDSRAFADGALVVLSDGRMTGGPSSLAIDAAEAARRAGIGVFVVGFGPELDEVVLRRLAAEPNHYLPARSAALLPAAFEALRTRLPCPPEGYWPRRQPR
jgi:hypothetical protein